MPSASRRDFLKLAASVSGRSGDARGKTPVRGISGRSRPRESMENDRAEKIPIDSVAASMGNQ